MIDLYGMSSPNVRKVMIALGEAEVAYRFHHVDLFAGQQFEPWFRAMSPAAKVPVLVDHEAGATLFESGAILLHLAERSGSMLPPAGPARREALAWLMLQVAAIGPTLGQLNHFAMWAPAGNDYALGRFRREAGRLYRLLDDRLADRPWLAGGAMTVADVATYPWAIYLERHGFDAAAFPALARWRAAMAARPAVAAAMAEADAIERQDAACFAAASEAQRARFLGWTEDE